MMQQKLNHHLIETLISMNLMVIEIKCNSLVNAQKQSDHTLKSLVDSLKDFGEQKTQLSAKMLLKF